MTIKDTTAPCICCHTTSRNVQARETAMFKKQTKRRRTFAAADVSLFDITSARVADVMTVRTFTTTVFITTNNKHTNFIKFFLLFAIVTTFEILFVFVHVCLSKRSSSRLMWKVNGATENARHENTGRSKMQGWKMRDMNLRHQIAGVENTRHENAGPICKGGKCGKS